MTRVTNFGRKRTYLQAGFGTSEELPQQSEDQNVAITNHAQEATVGGESASADVEGEPPKKKRKRIRKKKPRADAEASTGKEGDGEGVVAGGAIGQNQGDKDGEGGNGPSNKALKKKRWKEKEKEKKQRRECCRPLAQTANFAERLLGLLSSEMRRQKRIQGRLADTTCFACREKGHAAKDCPKVKSEAGSNATGTKAKTKGVVGICYRYVYPCPHYNILMCVPNWKLWDIHRCGSTRHTLSKCKKAVDESNPLPFASCFVCNGNGHLASSCPQNAEKGIYPNGGCCKLCGEKTHLAKDCELRKKGRFPFVLAFRTASH